MLDLVRESPKQATKTEEHLEAGSGGRGNHRASPAPRCRSFQDRAALIKLVQNFYFTVEAKGNQSIWAVDHPRTTPSGVTTSSTAWARSALKAGGGARAAGIRRQPAKADVETALQLARKWSMDVQVKLGSKDAATKASVKRWFHGDTATDAEITTSILALSTGFKKITDLCNSTR